MSTGLLQHPSRDVARGTAVGALVGAGVIHFAYAPTHLDHGLNHGAFFLSGGGSSSPWRPRSGSGPAPSGSGSS